MIRGSLLVVTICCACVLAQAADPASGGAPPAAAPSADVTYVANEGFLIEAGGRKIAVDAFFEGEEIDWCHAPKAATVKLMRDAAGPFEGIDLILVTHGHIDHFNPGLVLAHLRSNPGAVVVGPPQVVSKLRAHEGWMPAFEPRIRELDLPLHGSKELAFDGIRVEAHRLRHGSYPIKDEVTGEERNKHENVENLVYVVEAGGVTVMHFGDAFFGENADYLDGKRFPARKVDVVFTEDLSRKAVEIIDRLLDPVSIVMMHMSPDPERVARLERHLSTALPNAVVFHEMMERRGFEARAVAESG